MLDKYLQRFYVFSELYLRPLVSADWCYHLNVVNGDLVYTTGRG